MVVLCPPRTRVALYVHERTPLKTFHKPYKPTLHILSYRLENMRTKLYELFDSLFQDSQTTANQVPLQKPNTKRATIDVQGLQEAYDLVTVAGN